MRLYTAISLTKRHKKRLERDKLCSGTRLDIRIDIGPLRKLYCDETPPAKKSLSGMSYVTSFCHIESSKFETPCYVTKMYLRELSINKVCTPIPQKSKVHLQHERSPRDLFTCYMSSLTP